MRTLLLSLGVSLFLIGAPQAQRVELSRKGRELAEKASKAWEQRALDKAETYYLQLTEIAPDFGIAHLRLGQIYEWKKAFEIAGNYYERAAALNPQSKEALPAFQWLARKAEQSQNYSLAADHWEKIIDLFSEQKNSNVVRLAERHLASARFAKRAMERPSDIQRTPLSETVNRLQLQFFPVLTADNETLFFTGLERGGNEDIYMSKQVNGEWTVPVSIAEIINTDANEGTCTISADGHTLVFTGCNRRDGFGSCDLYISYLKNGRWSKPENVGQPVNSRHWESQPSLSADGSVLYFASDRPGGIGRSDIWKSVKNDNGRWTEPINLGEGVNTVEDENAPFIHANGTTLFYSSKGLPGMGGFDVYMVDLASKTDGKPVNLGYPINNNADQVGLFITADGETAYYTEDRSVAGEGRSSKLYTFEIPSDLKERFVPTRYVKGRILDSETKQPLQASIKLYDLATHQLVAQFSSDEVTGAYLAVVNNDSHYALYVEREGYLFKSFSFDISHSDVAIHQDIPIEQVKKDNVEVLTNVYFDTGDFNLSEKSKLELDKLVGFLNLNNRLSIEIAGHTDDVGSEEANLKLSEKRAESVVNYLTERGVERGRVSFKGYGEQQPRVPNDNEKNRSQNRRIEWRIR